MSAFVIELAILCTALIIDLVFGEPPAALHPVVWMGKVINFLRRLPVKGPWPQLVYGALMVVGGVALFTVPTWLFLNYLWQTNMIVYWLVGSLILKSTFSWRALFEAADKVKDYLERGELDGARHELRNLVSRDTSTLAAPSMVAATVESVAENSGDSVIAPLFYFALFGVPGAVAYRVINTFDSMIGYHGEYEYLGKAAARLDDLANLVPARLAGLCLVVASRLNGYRIGTSWQTMWRYHRVTESPNAGWPMSAMAGALGVRLEKMGHYQLGDGESPLNPTTIVACNRLVSTSLVVATLGCAVALVIRDVYSF